VENSEKIAKKPPKTAIFSCFFAIKPRIFDTISRDLARGLFFTLKTMGQILVQSLRLVFEIWPFLKVFGLQRPSLGTTPPPKNFFQCKYFFDEF